MKGLEVREYNNNVRGPSWVPAKHQSHCPPLEKRHNKKHVLRLWRQHLAVHSTEATETSHRQVYASHSDQLAVIPPVSALDSNTNLGVLRTHFLGVHDLMSSSNLQNVLEEALVLTVPSFVDHDHALLIVHC